MVGEVARAQCGTAEVFEAAVDGFGRAVVRSSARGEGPPDSYLVGTGGEQVARYSGNAAEVVIQILRAMHSGAPPPPEDPELQIGFPGQRNAPLTYVGSWQWNIHGEAVDDEFIRRAASATLTAISIKKEADAGHAR